MEQRNWVKRSFPTFLRWAKRGALIVVVVLIVLLILDTALTLVLQRRVESKIAEIREAGGAMTFSELVGELLSDQKNAMIHYSYALSIMGPVLAEYDGLGYDVYTAFHTLPRSSMMSERERSRAVGHEYERGVEAATKYLEKVQSGVEVDGREIEIAARHIFTKMEPGLQVVKDARALDQAQMLVDYDIGVDAASRSILPHLARMRALARYVGDAAILEAREGNMKEASELISAGLHIANALKREPLLITQLVLMAIGGIAIGAMYETLEEGYLPDERLREIIAELDELRDRRPFAGGLQGELCFFLARDRQLMGASYVGRPFRLVDEEAYLKYMPRVIEFAAVPSYESRLALKELGDEVSTISKLKVATRTTVPAFSRALPAQDRIVVQCDLAEMAIYLKQLKKKTGSYPEKLDAIVPEYIQELPVDPFTGAPYLYRKESEGFVLYSVSVNLVDDGGKPDAREGDIVWRSSR